MHKLILPCTAAAHYILETKLPMGIVELDAAPESSTCFPGGICYRTDCAPARTVPVILALYHACAYPAAYYKHPVQVDVKPSIDI